MNKMFFFCLQVALLFIATLAHSQTYQYATATINQHSGTAPMQITVVYPSGESESIPLKNIYIKRADPFDEEKDEERKKEKERIEAGEPRHHNQLHKCHGRQRL